MGERMISNFTCVPVVFVSALSNFARYGWWAFGLSCVYNCVLCKWKSHIRHIPINAWQLTQVLMFRQVKKKKHLPASQWKEILFSTNRIKVLLSYWTYQPAFWTSIAFYLKIFKKKKKKRFSNSPTSTDQTVI